VIFLLVISSFLLIWFFNVLGADYLVYLSVAQIGGASNVN
jgi:hypothetical protein